MTDPDAIMAEHHRIYEMYCDACQPATHWPCLPYRLAADNAALRAAIERVEALHFALYINDEVTPSPICSGCAQPHEHKDCPTRAALALTEGER
jgi:hypothetical protein